LISLFLVQVSVNAPLLAPLRRFHPMSAQLGPPTPTAPAPASRACPRITWFMLHAVGLGLLRLSGTWNSWSRAPGTVVETLTALTVLLYTATSFADPGFLTTDEAAPPGDTNVPGRSARTMPLLELPQCVHCNAYQVARAKHCHDCARCVRRLDHHCWWLANCVGAGNHRLFLAYLTLQVALLAAIGVTAARGLGSADWGAGAAALACVVLSVTMGALATILLSFQCGLVARGETTWEHLRRDRLNVAAQLPPHVRPYDRGVWANCASFICGTRIAPGPLVVVSAVPIASTAGSTASPSGTCVACDSSHSSFGL
jgi:palmitoyltransferase